MPVKFQLEPRRWYGWVEAPPGKPGWAASPIFITATEPLKSGAGLLKLEFLQPMRAGGGCKRSVVLKVIQHSSRHLAASFDDNSVARIAVLSAVDYDWLENFCQIFLERRPPHHRTWIIDGEPAAGLTVQEYLDNKFHSTEEEILAGARPASFGVKLRRMPKQRSSFDLETFFEPLDSWLISRGFVPKQMEDKWFIYLKDEKLCFHRSWTGILIYEVNVFWDEVYLHLGKVSVNRNPSQYGETDDNYDAAMLSYLIDVVLRGVPSSFPIKQGDEEMAPLQAWSVAGNASLNG